MSKIPAGGLTARQLRQIKFNGSISPLKKLVKAAKAIANAYNETAQDDAYDKDLRLAKIAAVYVDVLLHRSPKANADCAERLGLSPSQVRDAIHKARVRKLLTPSRGQGYAGGELTSTARALLEGDGQGTAHRARNHAGGRGSRD